MWPSKKNHKNCVKYLKKSIEKLVLYLKPLHLLAWKLLQINEYH